MDDQNSNRPIDLIPEPLRGLAAERIAKRDWFGVLLLVSSEVRPALAEALWPQLAATEKPDVLAEAISGGDAPSLHLDFFWGALDDLREAGLRAFDSDAARERYDALPDVVTVYRGTVKAEADGELTGVCWTLQREKAIWFATSHGRFRNRKSPPVLLTASIEKHEILGLLTGRNEDEVILHPFVDDFRIEYLQAEG
jgi:hypothetical protein